MDCVDTTPMAGFVIKAGESPTEDPPTHTFSCLRELGFPKFKRGKTDNTCLSAEDMIKAFCSGFAEYESLSVTLRFDADDYDFLFQMAVNADDVHWLIQFPLVGDQVSHSTFTFTSWIEELSDPPAKAAGDDKVDLTFAVLPQNVDFTPGA